MEEQICADQSCQAGPYDGHADLLLRVHCCAREELLAMLHVGRENSAAHSPRLLDSQRPPQSAMCPNAPAPDGKSEGASDVTMSIQSR